MWIRPGLVDSLIGPTSPTNFARRACREVATGEGIDSESDIVGLAPGLHRGEPVTVWENPS